jgi:hypothetical protein
MKSFSRKIGGFLLLSIGLLVFFMVSKYMIKDFPIWFIGQDVSAIVKETWYEKVNLDDPADMTFEYFVRYEFTTEKGKIIIGTSRLGVTEWMRSGPGTNIKITHSPFNAENNRVDDSRYVPLLLCAYLPFIFLLWLGIYSGWNILVSEFKKPDSYPWFVKR